jgi:hypothetical protein
MEGHPEEGSVEGARERRGVIEDQSGEGGGEGEVGGVHQKYMIEAQRLKQKGNETKGRKGKDRKERRRTQRAWRSTTQGSNGSRRNSLKITKSKAIGREKGGRKP